MNLGGVPVVPSWTSVCRASPAGRDLLSCAESALRALLAARFYFRFLPGVAASAFGCLGGASAPCRGDPNPSPARPLQRRPPPPGPPPAEHTPQPSPRRRGLPGKNRVVRRPQRGRVQLLAGLLLARFDDVPRGGHVRVHAVDPHVQALGFLFMARVACGPPPLVRVLPVGAFCRSFAARRLVLR